MAFAMASLSLLAEVSPKQYRTVPGERGTPCPQRNCWGEYRSNYSLHFAEYKDNGSAWNPQQMTDALDTIRTEKEKKGYAFVLVYVHGWKHSASGSPEDSDVTQFKRLLDDVSMLSNKGSPLPLVGVYIGWRGKSMATQSQLLSIPSYWGRRNTARSVGVKDLQTDLAKLTELAHGGETGKSTQIIVVGHSMGARVVENALAEINRKWLDANQFRRNGAEVSRPPADLVVYLNAATPSTLTRRTLNRLRKDGDVVKRHPHYSAGRCHTGNASTPECRAYPIFMAITSSGDWETRFLMPFANFIGPVGLHAWHLLSAAATPSLRSHRLKPIAGPSPPGTEKPGEVCAENKRTKDEDCYFLESLPSAPPNKSASFWIAKVSRKISENHTDIWNKELWGMLSSLLPQQGEPLPSNRVPPRPPPPPPPPPQLYRPQ
ncbi:MAG: hypothetical protein NTV70_08360 [Acidobacteria bacterium]|nr:hypothetical protein [Acidobacteriota bacterium]